MSSAIFLCTYVFLLMLFHRCSTIIIVPLRFLSDCKIPSFQDPGSCLVDRHFGKSCGVWSVVLSVVDTDLYRYDVPHIGFQRLLAGRDGIDSRCQSIHWKRIYKIVSSGVSVARCLGFSILAGLQRNTSLLCSHVLSPCVGMYTFLCVSLKLTNSKGTNKQ